MDVHEKISCSFKNPRSVFFTNVRMYLNAPMTIQTHSRWFFQNIFCLHFYCSMWSIHTFDACPMLLRETDWVIAWDTYFLFLLLYQTKRTSASLCCIAVSPLTLYLVAVMHGHMSIIVCRSISEIFISWQNLSVMKTSYFHLNINQ